MIRCVSKLLALLFLMSSLCVQAQIQPINLNAPPTLSNLTASEVIEGQPIAVRISVTSNFNRIDSVTMSTRAEGLAQSSFTSAGTLSRVSTTNVYQGSITSRPYGGYTLRVTVRYVSQFELITNPINPKSSTISTDKTFVVSAGANCFAFDQAGNSEGWSGTQFRVHSTDAPMSCTAAPLQNTSANWPFNVANSGRGGLVDSSTFVDLCDVAAQSATAFWRTEYVSPDLTNRAEFQSPTEIVLRVRPGTNILLNQPFVQIQAQSPSGFRVPRDGTGNAVFVKLGETLDTGLTANGRLRNTVDPTTGWNIIRWQPAPAITESITRLRIRHLDTFKAIRDALAAPENTYTLPKVDGVCAIR